MDESMRPRAAWMGACVALLLLGWGLGRGPGASAGEPPATRVPGSIELLGSPDGIDPYVIVPAFPRLTFDRPVWIGHPPDGTDVLWVGEQRGVLKVFRNTRDVAKASVALDLHKQVARTHNEEGLQGVAFHPGFKKNKTLFVTYSADKPRRLVLSRFETSGTRRRVRADTERVLLRQREPYGNHNGGCVAFGPDGRLYLSLGDGGSYGDPQNHAQNLDDWLGTILRLDVSGKKRVTAPADNPFVGVQHTKPEIYAYGFQNPRRFSFDSVTDRLWVGDVGNDRFQEVNRVERGGNYGWNLREGKAAFKAGHALVDLHEPLLALGKAKAQRITGGVVYRGKRLPGLIGAYLYGDSATGAVWALRTDGTKVTENKLLGRGVGISCFGEDRDGEVYFTSYDGKVYTLAPSSGEKSKAGFPRRLSDTGLFTDTHALTPHPALIPYEVNVPLWSDGAHKQRFLMLPGMQKIKVDRAGKMTFPVGTIFVKTFYLGDKARGPLPGTRLETRLFVHQERGWVGYTYVWNDEQTDAQLLDGRLDQARVDVHTSEGAAVNWTFPSRSDCMTCHTEVAGRVLGFRAEQINRSVGPAGAQRNQIDIFRALGLFEGKLTSKAAAWPDWGDPQAKPRAVVRAWLDANCAMCHQPNGPGNALIDLRYDTPIKKTNMLGRKPGQWNLGIYGAMLLVPGHPERSLVHARIARTDHLGMPPIGHHLVDKTVLDRVAAWIKQLR